MSDTTAILVALGTVALFGLLIWVLVRSQNKALREEREEEAAKRADFDDEGIQDDTLYAPLPVKPDDLPRVLNYNPRPGRPAIFCTKHKEPLEPGPVLWWPTPNDGVLVFCEEILREVELKRVSGQ